MTPKEFAALLNGRLYGQELAPDEKHLARESGLVVVFGDSDDLMKITGAINDEADCFDGGTFYISRDGLICCEEEFEDTCEECPLFMGTRESTHKITAIWRENESPCWTYKTDVPHEEFNVLLDDGEVYCTGIVFRLCDLGESGDWTPVEKGLPEHRVDVLLCFRHNYAVGFYDHEHEFWGINTGDGMFSAIHEGEPLPLEWKPIPEDS